MKSYIKFLSRNKLYTAIEAVGLAVSLAFVILIGTYVWQQYTVASDCPDSERVYMIGTTDFLGLGEFDNEELDAGIPEVEISSRYRFNDWSEKVCLNGDEYRTVYSSADVDRDFFDIFPHSYELMVGSLDGFNTEDIILLSRSFADKFTEKDLIGQILSTELGDYRIAGIYDDDRMSIFPAADLIYPFSTNLTDEHRFMVTETFTFFKTVSGVTRDEIEGKVIPMCMENYSDDELDGAEVMLFSLNDLYFSDLDNYSTAHADKSFLTVLLFIVLALLVSSVFNYINLSFAMTGRRAKEMASRRLVGASAKDIFLKCVLESVAFTLVCFAAAMLIAVALEPVMNRYLVDDYDALFVPLRINLTAGYLLATMALVVLIGIVSGIVPAWHATYYKPVEVANGLYRRKSKMIFSKVFITVQNTLSVILISVAILMEVQLGFMMNRPLNSTSENMFHFGSEETWKNERRAVLAEEFRKLAVVKNVGLSTGWQGNMESGSHMPSKSGRPIRVMSISCDSSYFRMLDPVILEDFGTSLVRSVWFSESAAADMGLNAGNAAEFEDVISSKWMMPYDYHIGGIYRDIPNTSPLDSWNDYSCLRVEDYVKLNLPANIVLETVSENPEVRREILTAYDSFCEKQDIYGMVGEATFVSDAIYSSLEPTRRQIRLIEIFMFIAVLLSLMGLLAMSTYFSGQKSKEIAIRKVFGGTVESETLASVRSYMLLVLIACVIGVPVAVYASGRYLEQFAVRVSNYWWIFVVAVVLSFAISLLSVLWQILKSARTNPASELKKE